MTWRSILLTPRGVRDDAVHGFLFVFPDGLSALSARQARLPAGRLRKSSQRLKKKPSFAKECQKNISCTSDFTNSLYFLHCATQK